jgi:IclR family acetate operon transcriptional repressor
MVPIGETDCHDLSVERLEMAKIVPLNAKAAGSRPGGDQPPSRGTGQVQSLTRALRIMNALAEQAHGFTLSDLAHTVNLPTSTAHRLLTTLQNERYVRFDSERSVWMIGVQAFQVGSVYARSRDLVSIARPYMRRLMEESGETANLAIIDRGEVIFLAQVECQKMMRAVAGPGGRAPLHCTGTGKAMLAWLPERESLDLLRSRAMHRETPNTVQAEAALVAALPEIRHRGYAVDDEENAIGLRCVASVIFDEHVRPLAGISISGPTARLTEARLPILGTNVAKIAAEITAEMGGRLPDGLKR